MKPEALILELKGYINSDPQLLSLLYDLDMLPEQLEEGTKDWARMLMIAEAWRIMKHDKIKE